MKRIDLIADYLEKPKNISVRAELAWNYFSINDGGWLAAPVSDCGVLVVDESGDLSACSWVFKSEELFVSWLESVTDEWLNGTNDERLSFLVCSGAVSERVASDTVVDAIVAKIYEKEE